MTPLRGERARTPRRPLRAAPRRSAEPRGGIGGRLGRDGGCQQPADVTRRAEQAPGRARRVSIAVRPPRGEKRRGERIAAFLGEVPASPAKPSPPHSPRPTHARRAPPAAPQPGSPPPPAPQPSSASLALPALPRTCPAPARRPPAASPFPTEKQKSPAEEPDGRLSTGSLRDFPPHTPFFFFSLSPKMRGPFGGGG